MKLRSVLTRIVGGAPYPQEVADRLDAAVNRLNVKVDELNAATEELRAMKSWLEEGHGGTEPS